MAESFDKKVDDESKSYALDVAFENDFSFYLDDVSNAYKKGSEVTRDELKNCKNCDAPILERNPCQTCDNKSNWDHESHD